MCLIADDTSLLLLRFYNFEDNIFEHVFRMSSLI